MPEQLPLAVGLRDDNSFDNYLESVNAEALGAVRALLAGAQPFVFLCGDADSGRTHLLEAAAAAMHGAGLPVAYVALGAATDPGILESLGDSSALVCLDDLDQVAGRRDWEEALFHLFNALRQQGGRLLAAASAAPATLPWSLPDLASRLGSGLVVRLAALDDEQRLAVLVHRAACRGLVLPPETGRYLLTRTRRRLADLVVLLAELDRAALVHQRHLTVPFVRRLLRP